mgnify:CR=1 FL=1
MDRTGPKPSLREEGLPAVEEGLFPGAECVAGTWRLTSVGLLRARRMRQLERDFDAVPELAALVADLIEEMDKLRDELRARANARS